MLSWQTTVSCSCAIALSPFESLLFWALREGPFLGPDLIKLVILPRNCIDKHRAFVLRRQRNRVGVTLCYPDLPRPLRGAMEGFRHENRDIDVRRIQRDRLVRELPHPEPDTAGRLAGRDRLPGRNRQVHEWRAHLGAAAARIRE